MADTETSVLDPAQQEEFVRQMAARRASLAASTPTPSTPTLRGISSAPQATPPPPPVSRVAQVKVPEQGVGLPAVGSTADLESHIKPVDPAIAQAAAKRGTLPVQQQAKATEAAKSPEDQAVDSASQRVEDLRNKKAGIARLIPITEGDGWGHKILRGVEHVGRGLATGLETVGDIAAPGIMMNIPGTEFHRNIQLQGANEQLAGAEKNRLEAGQAQEQQATAEQKRNMQAQITAAREKGWDLSQDPVTGAWAMKEDPTYSQRATATKELEPKIEVSPESGAVVQLSPDPKNPGKMVSSPVLDANGKATVLPPKPQGYDIKEEMQPDGKVHNVAYDKADPSKKIVLGLSKPAAGGEGKIYDNYSKQLDKVASPVDKAMGDANTLTNLLDQKTKQADSLVAPKILTLVAGGAGTGLRMTDAEISRIVGGRSVWDSLKSGAQKVEQDAAQFDDAQRAQLTQIAQYMQTKVSAKSYLINQGREQMLTVSHDDDAVRKVYAHMQRAISDLEQRGITPPGQPLRSGDYTWRDGKLYEIEIENGKPMGVPVEVK